MILFVSFNFRATLRSVKQKLTLNLSNSAKDRMRLCIKVIASEYRTINYGYFPFYKSFCIFESIEGSMNR